MNPTHQALIINIGHEHEPHIYTVRLKPSNDLLAGFQTIQQLDHWLKMNGGKFTLDPRELPEGWQREAQIATWAYNQMVMARSQAALRQAQDGKAA